jgi:hypothetical protein
MLISQRKPQEYNLCPTGCRGDEVNAGFMMGNRMIAPFALMPCEPISIDDYSILVWMPKYAQNA